MQYQLPSEADVSAAVILARLTGCTESYRTDPCPGAVADVLVAFAFLVGMQAGAGRPGAARRILRQVAEERPAAFRRTADLASALFEPEPAAAC
jgi:hypothetical protein